MKKIVFISIILLLFFANVIHASSFKNVVGKYKGDYDSFIFNADSTFIYEYRFYDGYMKSSGKWTISDNKIILNSDIQNNAVPLKVSCKKKVEFPQSTIINVYLNANEGYSEKDYQCIININGKENILYTETGSYSVKTASSVEEISFEIRKDRFLKFGGYPVKYPLKTDTVKIDNLFYEEIDVYIDINDSLFYYRVFTNDIIEKKKGIIFWEKVNGEIKGWELKRVKD